MIFMENERQASVHFNSVLDLLEVDSSEFDFNSGYFKRQLSRTNLEAEKFGFTNRNGDDVIQHALLGDHGMEEAMKKKFDSLDYPNSKDIEQVITKVKRKKIKSDFGNEYDIHKAYQGQFDKAWTKTVRVEQDEKHHLITLYVDIGDNWGVECEDSLWRGAVLMSLCKQFEIAGKSVKIICGFSANGAFVDDSRKFTSSIVIKNYSERLSDARLAAMSNLGFFRIFGFASFYAQGKYKVTGNKGCSNCISNADAPIQLQPDIDAGHTKLIYVKRSNNMKRAKLSIDDVYNQINNSE